jgi:hypothetical protein
MPGCACRCFNLRDNELLRGLYHAGAAPAQGCAEAHSQNWPTLFGPKCSRTLLDQLHDLIDAKPRERVMITKEKLADLRQRVEAFTRRLVLQASLRIRLDAVTNAVRHRLGADSSDRGAAL